MRICHSRHLHSRQCLLGHLTQIHRLMHLYGRAPLWWIAFKLRHPPYSEQRVFLAVSTLRDQNEPDSPQASESEHTPGDCGDNEPLHCSRDWIVGFDPGGDDGEEVADEVDGSRDKR
jgi:hypothetical protein